ncbi:MAG TPA: beta-L-arabinofuranosidase domain-containing protein [Vicinamibacterales bacterium]|nr:beta-L-arabinofuranosidase domain-containing protein [Vicinamibacterales bacterium]
MRTLKVFALATLALVTTLTAQDQWGRQVTVPNKVAFKAVSFQLEDVRLLDGPFKDAMVRDQQYLLSLEPDRMLHTFRLTADLPSTATPLGGWESPTTELRGHSMGHYLSAVAIMYASTGDARFKQRGDLLVAELAKVQAAESAKFHPGYLSAFPEEFFDRLDARTQVWAPWYTIHKIMAGLLDMYQQAHNAQALDVLKKQAGWVRFRVDRLTEAQQQADLRTEFGGMAEVLANLYGVTGDAEWLRVAKKFDDKLMFDPLAENNDPLVDANGRGVHGNTQIPKMIASAREYELTADPRYKAIASNFWHIVAQKRSYVIGGNTDGESFFPVDNFDSHLGLSSAETCNTYNMLKLTRHLFSWEPTAETMDFYERALFNQILPSQDPKTGGVIYYTPLRPGAFKVFSSQNDSFWCCVGTGMENHGKYNDTIYFHDDASLYLNLFIPSELTWKDKGLTVRQETKFPSEDSTKLTFTAAKPVKLALKIRRPGWAVGLSVTVNGKLQTVNVEPGGYVTVNGEWKTGDTVTVKTPMTLHVEPLPNSKVYQAFMYGPVVLAGDLGTSGMEGANRYSPNVPAANIVPPAAHVEIPVFVSANLREDLGKVTKIAGKPLTFIVPQGLAQPGSVTLVPFYTLFEPRYTIYWKVYQPADWMAMTKSASDAAARRKILESKTIDFVDVASDASETAHALSSQSLGRGRGVNAPPAPGPAQPTQLDGRRGREARGGFLSYTLKVAPDVANLVVTYRIEGAGAPRTFDVLVDGTKIASESLTSPTAQFFDKEYALPAAVTSGKSQVTVRFETPAPPPAAPDAAAAGAGRGGRGGAAIASTATIFDVRTVRR